MAFIQISVISKESRFGYFERTSIRCLENLSVNKKLISEYDQETPKSHTTDQPMAPRGSVKERQHRHDIHNTTKVKQPALSFPAR